MHAWSQSPIHAVYMSVQTRNSYSGGHSLCIQKSEHKACTTALDKVLRAMLGTPHIVNPRKQQEAVPEKCHVWSLRLLSSLKVLGI